MNTEEIIKKLDDGNSISEVFFDLCNQDPQETLARVASTTTSYSRDEFRRRVVAVIEYLRSKGVGKGSHVAILSNTRPEWLIADLAIMSLGAVTISIYQSLPASEVGFILWDSQSTIVFAENIEQVEKLRFVQKNEIVCPAFEGKGEQECFKAQVDEIITFEEVADCSSFKQIISKPSVLGSLPSLTRDTISSFVYTSGTTGAPKGVVQTHGNHLSNIRQALEGGLYQPWSSIFLMLPLAHSFARLMAYISVCTGVVIIFPRVPSTMHSKQDPAMSLQDMANAKASIVPLVPRILEKIKETLEVRASKNTLGGKLIRALLPRDGKGNFFTPLFGRMIKKAIFGGSFSYALSGGAKLDPKVNAFFDALGIEVLEGYGLTETCVATNCNRIGQKKLGTVGPVLASDIEVRIAEDGEILFKGPNITGSYWNRPEATKQAWDQEGWFHTGDLGALDPDGALRITGRKKELIVTANGKKIVPEGIEFKIKALPIISNAVLYGDGKPYCCALITLQRTLVAEQFGEGEGGIQKAVVAIQHHLDEVNALLANFEVVKKFKVIDVEFTIDNGLLTPTLKLKRNEVMKRFRADFEELYCL